MAQGAGAATVRFVGDRELGLTVSAGDGESVRLALEHGNTHAVRCRPDRAVAHGFEAGARQVTTRERLRRLVDLLPEAELAGPTTRPA